MKGNQLKIERPMLENYATKHIFTVINSILTDFEVFLNKTVAHFIILNKFALR